MAKPWKFTIEKLRAGRAMLPRCGTRRRVKRGLVLAGLTAASRVIIEAPETAGASWFSPTQVYAAGSDVRNGHAHRPAACITTFLTFGGRGRADGTRFTERPDCGPPRP